ncbi:MAG TPA: ribulose-phosphate 3-epimerase [Terriglobia bacterium]|jgi:ribulose-phosphate 3-epimerase|nr:ribulose-phosphate 3-epimerase [Terriglobia bacterium]
MALIAPSLLAGDFAKLGETLGAIRNGGANLVHVDVMDGHFVPEISIGQPVIASLRKATDLTLDVHLEIERPDRYAGEFADLGADRVAVPFEVTPRLSEILQAIRAKGCHAGVAISPATPLENVSEVLAEIDFLTILGAEAALREQRFSPRMTGKVRQAARLRQETGTTFAIQVEGGIGAEHVVELASAGADILVVGSAIFESGNPAVRLREMVHLVASARQTSMV